jgi:uncharacterized protein (TIRG00374 family)
MLWPMNKLTPPADSMQRSVSKGASLLRSFIKLALAAGVVALFLYVVDIGELIAIVSGLNLWLLLPAFALVYVDRSLSAYKWRPLLRAVGVNVPFSVLIKIYLVAPLVGLLIPATVARDGFRFFMLSRYKVDRRSVLASIIAERVIGFVAIMGLVVVSLGIAFYLFRDSWGYFRETLLLLLVGVLVAGFMVGMAIGGFKKGVDWLAGRLDRVPLVGKLHHIYTLYSEYRKHLGTVAAVLAMTIVEQMVPVLVISLLAFALHIDVSLLELFSVIPIILLVARLPLPLEGIGISEGLSILLLGIFGVSPTEAVSLSLLGRLTEYLSSAPVAAYFIFKGKQAFLPVQSARVSHP